MGRLDGKTAVVTGAARGIGAATARRLAADGARVAAVDLDEAGCAETVATIASAGGTAVALTADVRAADQVEQALAAAVDRLGGLDILVSNAGVLRDNLLFRMSEADWDTVLDTHLKGGFLVARAAQRHMVEQRSGVIVFLSSTSALGNRGQANYAAAKAGLQGLTKTLAIELGPFNVRVNAVAPGFIETDMTRATAERLGMDFDAFMAEVAAQVPLRRAGRPADVANVIAFLASDDAGYVSGQVLYVAGGPRD